MDAISLATTHARNKQVVEELRALRTEPRSLLSGSPDYANYYPRMIASLQRVYERLLAAVNALEYIGLEGVQQVTLQSRTETLIWSLDREPGASVAEALLEHLRDQLAEVENKILEAKGRLAGEYTGGTTEEWHHENIHALALLLEAVPTLNGLAANGN